MRETTTNPGAAQGPISAKILAAAMSVTEVLASCGLDDEAHKKLHLMRKELLDAASQAACLERAAIIDLSEVAA